MTLDRTGSVSRPVDPAPGRVATAAFVAALPARAVAAVDEPDDLDRGDWWVDVILDGVSDTVGWYPGVGFALWTGVPVPFLTAPDHRIVDPREAARKFMEINGWTDEPSGNDATPRP